MIAAEKKKYRDRAVRALRELEKEKAMYGQLNDGPGRRYRIGVFFLLAGELRRAAEFFDRFDDEFAGDMGEPASNLYGALAAFRCGESDKARARLLNASISNIYLLPMLVGRLIEMQNIWHPSNRHQPDYLLEIEEFLDEPTRDEREWIKSELATTAFTEIKVGYIAAFVALHNEHDLNKRKTILNEWNCLQSKYLVDSNIESATTSTQ